MTDEAPEPEIRPEDSVTDPQELSPGIGMSLDEYKNGVRNRDSIRMANGRMLMELGQVGATINFVPSLVTSMFRGLVEVGVLTPSQLLAMELMWETEFHKQLESMHADVMEQMQRLQTQARLGLRPDQMPGTRSSKPGARKAAKKQGLILPGQG